MKRRYKEGDWFRIPLDAAYDALGVIARACRSRLFGYFFALPAGAALSPEDLRSLRAIDAAACALFGGAPLEDARWPVVATSVRFDPDAWPFPQFVSRGAFARTWHVRTYDPDTMQAVAVDASTQARAAGLPDARFATAEELETLLRERICGAAPEQPLAIAEVRSPLDPGSLHVLARGGRVQFSELLDEADLDMIANFISEHPLVELRVHGIESFDLCALQRFRSLRSLLLDVPSVRNAHALVSLTQLRTLRIAAMRETIPFPALPQLRKLELHGKRAGTDLLHSLHALQSLTLSDAGRVRISEFGFAENLRELTLAHMPAMLDDIDALPALARLELRELALRELPDLSHNAALQSIALRGVRQLRDLRPLALAPALHELRIENMPQLGVADFEPLAAAAHLHAVNVDVGSRQKEREIYRLLRAKAPAP